MKAKIIQLILDYPKSILMFIIGLTVIFGSFLERPGLELDSSTENIFPQGSPEVKYFQTFRSVFGSDEFLVVVIHTPNQTVFRPRTLLHMKKLTDQFQNPEKVQHVELVLALTTAKKPRVKDINIDQVPGKKVFTFILNKLPPENRKTILREVAVSQLKKNKIKLPEKEIMGLVMRNITTEQQEKIIKDIITRQLPQKPVSIPEKELTNMVMGKLDKETQNKIGRHILMSRIQGKPLDEGEIFSTVFDALTPEQREEILQEIVNKHIPKPQQYLYKLVLKFLPQKVKDKFLKTLGMRQMQGKPLTNLEAFKILHSMLLPPKRKELVKKLTESYNLSQGLPIDRQKVFVVVFEHLTPEQREKIVQEVMDKYVKEKDLAPEKEEIFRTIYTHIPVGQRESLVKELALKFFKGNEVSMEIVDFFDFQKGKDGALEPPRSKGIKQSRDILLKIPHVRGLLLAREGDGLDKTAIVLQVKRPKVNPEVALAGIVKQVRKILVDTKTPGVNENIQYYIAGSPAIKADILKAIKLDVGIFVPITVLIIILLTYYLFRNVGSVILPLSVILVTDIWILGLMSFFGYPLNTLTSLIISLMFVIGVADVVHLLAKYFDEYEKTHDKRGSLEHMLDQLLLPCWITSFTTMIGFGSLLVSDIEPIREFGLFAAIGVMLALFLSVAIVPPALLIFPIRRETDKVEEAELTTGLKALYQTSKYKATVITSAILILVFSAYGVTKMNVETNFVEFFKEKSESRIATNFVEDHFAGIAPLEIVFKPKESYIQDPEVLKRIDKFQTHLRTDPFLKKYVDQTTSVVDFYKFAHMIKLPDIENIIKPEDFEFDSSFLVEERYTLPSDPLDYKLFDKTIHAYEGAEEGVKKFLAVSLDPADLTKMPKKEDWKIARISVRMEATNSRTGAEIIGKIRKYAEENFPKDDIHVTGTGALFAEAAESIVDGQKKSFLIAIVIIFITMVVVFRSLLVGLLGLIPNIFPIMTTFGAMGWLGIPLNSSTSMVASISIGIAVDVAVHFISRFRLEYHQGVSVRRALMSTYLKSGKPILFTSIILMAGFLVLTLASFVPTIQFGILTCITIFSALVAGLIILPSVIFLIYKDKPSQDGEGPGEKTLTEGSTKDEPDETGETEDKGDGDSGETTVSESEPKEESDETTSSHGESKEEPDETGETEDKGDGDSGEKEKSKDEEKEDADEAGESKDKSKDESGEKEKSKGADRDESGETKDSEKKKQDKPDEKKKETSETSTKTSGRTTKKSGRTKLKGRVDKEKKK